jgi:hypothetical protein
VIFEADIDSDTQAHTRPRSDELTSNVFDLTINSRTRLTFQNYTEYSTGEVGLPENVNASRVSQLTNSLGDLADDRAERIAQLRTVGESVGIRHVRKELLCISLLDLF